MNKNAWIVVIVVAAVFAGGGYLIGKQAAASTAPTGAGAYAGRTGAAGFTGRTGGFSGAGGGATIGTIIATGTGSFDPGSSAFGVFSSFEAFAGTNGGPRIAYSQDALNTWDAKNPRKVKVGSLGICSHCMAYQRLQESSPAVAWNGKPSAMSS